MKAVAQAVGALSLCLSGAAVAKERDGGVYLWPGERWSEPTRSVYDGLNEFAGCIVKLDPSGVQAMLALPAYGDDYRKANSDLIEKYSDACLNRIGMRIVLPDFRGALFEALYERDFGRSSLKSTPVDPKSNADQLLLASCVVNATLSGSERLIQTFHASKQQRAAFEAMGEAIKRCSEQTGKPVPSAQRLRYQITEALYQAKATTAAATAVEAAKK
jgi:hypothetical protein